MGKPDAGEGVGMREEVVGGLVAALLYLNTLNHQFVYDDRWLILVKKKNEWSGGSGRVKITSFIFT